MELFLSILRWVSVGSGVLLFLAALTLYENEQKKLQSHLETLWLKIRELQDQGFSRRNAFARVVAEWTARIVSLVYGERIFSLRALAASLSLSIASVVICGFLVMEIGLVLGTWERSDLGDWDVSGSLFLFAPFLLAKFQKRAPSIAPILLLALTASYLFMVRHVFDIQVGSKGFPDQNHRPEIFFLALMLSLLGDVALISIVRSFIKASARAIAFARVFVFALLNLLLAGIMVGAPFVLVMLEAVEGSLAFTAVAVASMTNLVPLLAAVLFFLLCLLMLMHALLWPVLARLLYPVANVRIFNNKKVLIGIAVGLIALGSKPFAQLIKGFL